MVAPTDIPELGKDAVNWVIQKGLNTMSIGLAMHYYEIQKSWASCGSDYVCKLEKLMLYFTAIFGGTSPAIAIGELAEAFVNKAWGLVQTGNQPVFGKDSWGPATINMMIYIYIEYLLTLMCDWVRYSTECLKQNVCENDNILVWIYNMKVRYCNKTETEVDVDVEVDCLEGECLAKDVDVPDVVYKITDNSDWCVIFFNEFPLLIMAMLIWSAYIVSVHFKEDIDKVRAAKAKVTGVPDESGSGTGSDGSGTGSAGKKKGSRNRKKGSGEGKGDGKVEGKGDGKSEGKRDGKGGGEGDSDDTGSDSDGSTDDDKQDSGSGKGESDSDSDKETGGTKKKKRTYTKKKGSSDSDKKKEGSSSGSKSGKAKGTASESSGPSSDTTQKVVVKCPTCKKIRDICMPNPLPVFCDKCGPKMTPKVKSTRRTDDGGFAKCKRKPKPTASLNESSDDSEDSLVENQHFMAINSTNGLTLAVSMLEKIAGDESDDHDHDDSSDDNDEELQYLNLVNFGNKHKNELALNLKSFCSMCETFHFSHDHDEEDSVDEDEENNNDEDSIYA